ncbi:hypothetical protein PGT21_029297 [Puccinia graminis f. sp. tritici]|uniref:Uncharacterized protein n=1 Tax=Puccinia graminis f. sp. tritici TaxID=56615 RepID=A0A5B0N5F3_PUCGR|nr:hypothetical protein PGT21_029297 [Puccinia graminis f. sp. tritici]KAA1133038.1 hypothetical protein PGTUg99_025068 [Puccinia graminis f. sp. tritici]
MNFLQRLYLTSAALALLAIHSAESVAVDCDLHFERSSDPLKTECWSRLNEGYYCGIASCMNVADNNKDCELHV